MRIVIDIREQAPCTFSRFNGLEIEQAALPRGDYSLPGFEDRAAIKRKSIEDLIGKRFEIANKSRKIG